MTSKITRQIKAGNLLIGGGAPVSVQSMTNTDTPDAFATAAQVNALAEAGADIVRIAVPNHTAANAIKEIKRLTNVPLVADIHFDYRLALTAIENGIDKVRINPGNIGSVANVKRVADAAKSAGVPIRVGVNSGSLEKNILAEHGAVTAEALTESAAGHIRLLEDAGFGNICVSMKSGDVKTTVAANRLFRERFDYPLHLGITAAGSGIAAAAKAAAGIGALLIDGIGDTVRVSMTGDPVQEVTAGIAILEAVGARTSMVDIISCPTCGRCKADLEAVIAEVRAGLKGYVPEKPIKVAIMGCEVNGPGEAKEADFGLACGPVKGILFAKGSLIKKTDMSAAAKALCALVLGRY
ncbi:MAG: flavodoxin-dependent (E)-4-hydroxy-3-methylbut-2-enyl-diphosphate synthase [Oscillospiraceae bacterium]|jgi:(E)-4-hydroxy-3-methylbut-2-enyl-diphosphate synthase|nr:flavodoxin-dependent (E)-4-hydroxy-3-methylbut-2-enyl-diphosphate synthase [Oscillospiraceae bacterium]